jgi:hypothetical protein
MFMLWAIPVGIGVGWLAGGRLDGLSRLRFRWAWIAVAGLLVQLVLFTPTGDRLAGSLGPAIYVGSTFAVFLAVLRNIRLPGMPIVALGSMSNILAITANGGFMPANPVALATAGLDGPGEHTNSVVLERPAFQPLTDIFAVPEGLPFANVFSIGDVLLGIGIVIVIAAAMRRPVPTGGEAARGDAAPAEAAPRA